MKKDSKKGKKRKGERAGKPVLGISQIIVGGLASESRLASSEDAAGSSTRDPDALEPKEWLLLSELGHHLLGGERGPAGVKRIASLLHSKRWRSGLIVKWLWGRGNEKVQELREQNEGIYVIRDESALEKSESLQADRLCAVWSSKAARLERIKPGYFNPPGGCPIFVPGFNWLKLLVTGMKETPMLAHLTWWTTQGKKASTKREVESKILRKVSRLWGRKALHLWDRGSAGSPWTTLALNHHLRFIVRWNTRYHLAVPMDINRKAGKSLGASVPGIIIRCEMPEDNIRRV